jgi:Holliday junction resolvasome RuvABC endonuclease subunit
MKNSMPQKEPILLCLDPGTREMGVAVLEGTDLIDYHVVTFRNGRKVRDLLNQTHQSILSLLETHRPDVVVIEKPFFAKTERSALLVFLVQELKRQVRKGRFRLLEFSPLEVREFLLDDRRATKRDIARHVGQRFPQLRQHLHFGEFWKEKYWSHVFDAVALGLAVDKSR